MSVSNHVNYLLLYNRHFRNFLLKGIDNLLWHIMSVNTFSGGPFLLSGSMSCAIV